MNNNTLFGINITDFSSDLVSSLLNKVCSNPGFPCLEIY